MISELFTYDKSRGEMLLCGIDEAGRGPLAGPVCAAAVILRPDFYHEDVKDSKKLSEKKREMLFDLICENAVCYHIEMVSPKEIDALNILNATMMAMKKCVIDLSMKPDLILVDGNAMPDFGELRAETVVKGDQKSACIAGASILAKVSRDRLMRQYGERYPEYGFDRHKGYGTKAHYEAIDTYGILPIHRKSFLKGRV